MYECKYAYKYAHTHIINHIIKLLTYLLKYTNFANDLGHHLRFPLFSHHPLWDCNMLESIKF